MDTHRAYETFLVPFRTHRIYCNAWYRSGTTFAFRFMQLQMTFFAVWVTFMNHEFVCFSIFFLIGAALFALFCSGSR